MCVCEREREREERGREGGRERRREGGVGKEGGGEREAVNIPLFTSGPAALPAAVQQAENTRLALRRLGL